MWFVVILMTIGNRIRVRREELGLSQEELAHKLGYKSKASISKIELGERQLRQKNILAIADALQTTPSYIMGWDNKKSENGELMTIGNRIQIRREELGLSQEELAHKLGYKSKVSICEIEKGRRQLRQKSIKAIADALQTTPSYIMGWEEEKSSQNDDKLKSAVIEMVKNIPPEKREDFIRYLETTVKLFENKGE